MRLLAPRAASLWLALALFSLSLNACSSDSTAPSVSPTASLTVDASTATAFVNLAQPRVVTGSDTTTSAWDVSVNTTTVTLNTANGVTGYCLCEHESATDADVMAMTADAELTTFDAVTPGAVPAASSFESDVFTTHKWYRYNLTGNDHQIWPTFNVYLIKHGSSVYKLQVTNYYDAGGAPRHITIRSAELGS